MAADIVSNMQFYCSTKEAFASLTNTECFVSKSIKDTFVANIFSFEYTVTFTGIHSTYNIPVVISVLIGRAYASDTISMATLATKQDDLIAYVKRELSEKAWTDDTMITTGEGFSVAETQVRTL